jgi:hypothetical protein
MLQKIAARARRARLRTLMPVEAITNIGTVDVALSERERWKSGQLAPEWKARFPQLFDDDDLRITRKQCVHGTHFYEWCGAIELHRTTSYLSLVEKYEFGKSSRSRVHLRKRPIVAQLLPPRVQDALSDRTPGRNTQAPDLLMYAEDRSDWFFCEVKGPGESVRPEQCAKFEWLAEMTSKPVRLLEFRLV